MIYDYEAESVMTLNLNYKGCREMCGIPLSALENDLFEIVWHYSNIETFVVNNVVILQLPYICRRIFLDQPQMTLKAFSLSCRNNKLLY